MTRKDKYAVANAKKRERGLWDDFVEREDRARMIRDARDDEEWWFQWQN